MRSLPLCLVVAAAVFTVVSCKPADKAGKRQALVQAIGKKTKTNASEGCSASPLARSDDKLELVCAPFPGSADAAKAAVKERCSDIKDAEYARVSISSNNIVSVATVADGCSNWKPE